MAQAVHDVGDMLRIELQKPAPDRLRGKVLPADAGILPLGAASLHHQFYIAVQQLLVVGILLQKNVILDIVHDQFPIAFHHIQSHPAQSALTGRGRIRRGGRG